MSASFPKHLPARGASARQLSGSEPMTHRMSNLSDPSPTRLCRGSARRSLWVTAGAAMAAFALSACSGGGGGGGEPGTSGNFVVLETEPSTNSTLFLNDRIAVDFSNPIDLTTADLNTFSFQVLDLQANPISGEQPSGTFELAVKPGDDPAAVKRRLVFVPSFPSNNTFDNGGFRPGREYLVQLVGGSNRNGTVLRDTAGKGLSSPVSFRFRTPDGTTASQLFRDRRSGGPRRAFASPSGGFEVSQADSLQNVPLNLLGQTPIEVRLTFDQPLNPSDANIPKDISINPAAREPSQRGRIFLEYDDPDPSIGPRAWIPAQAEIEVNDLESAVVVLRPFGVLPNNTTIRVIAESSVEDISGESNTSNAAYERIFATFKTTDGYAPQFDAFVENFDSAANINFGTPSLDPLARVQNGMLSANFEFGGESTAAEYEPTDAEVILNTDFTSIQPREGGAFNVSGGVFKFNRVRIPNGVTVRGIGTKPMVWLVNTDFVVDGLLSVRGGDGQRVNVLNSANFPSAGGAGICSGGNGGMGSQNTTDRTPVGQPGFGPGQTPGFGGGAGQLACTGTCNIGSGGGGGSFATQGDPFFKVAATPTFPEREGRGGGGCAEGAATTSRSALPGGVAGPLPFMDARQDNDFSGSLINIQRQIRITGELAVPLGGAGGGGGGDHSTAGCGSSPSGFISDDKGGGGGGGGGVLIVQALRDIRINGRINADGGNGGGGEQAGSCDQGGGGGSGSGGTIILMAARKIILDAKGDTYANNDFDFVLSADGGVCTTGDYKDPNIVSKYARAFTASQWNQRPHGGFGGLGQIQLLAPPGTVPAALGADMTNTQLDDNIEILVSGVPAVGADKQRFLAWRGFPNENGILVDDMNNAVNIGANSGDMRPTPLLGPVPFGARSSATSFYLDLGATNRRPANGPNGEPRTIAVDPVNGLYDGPTFDFGATKADGYVDFQNSGSSVLLSYPTILAQPADVVTTLEGETFNGQTAYRVDVANRPLGSVFSRYAHYTAQLLNGSDSVIGEARILGHTDESIWLSTDRGAQPTDAVRIQIAAKFFRVITDNREGLGPTYEGASRTLPIANVRIGFAYHNDPINAAPTGNDPARLPATVGEFLFDLSDPMQREQIRLHGATAIQYQVLFDRQYSESVSDPVLALTPRTPLPQLDYLLAPFYF